MVRKRKIPPSRLRYEQSHPTVSARLSRAQHNTLKELREKSGKSLADIIKVAICAQAPSVKQANKLGYQKGWQEAEVRFRVDYRCSVCGGSLTVNQDNSKHAAGEYMRKHGWAHGECHKRRG